MAELTAELIVDARVPSDARVSPDGRHVAFAVAPLGRREEHPQSALWLVPTDGAAPARQFTAGAAQDRMPRWSPDGAWLYFLSDRQERGKAQLCRLSPAGGEAEALTDWKAGLGGFVPLPDGRAVVAWAADPPTEEEERRRRERDDAQVYGERWPRQHLFRLDLATRDLTPLGVLPERHVVAVAPAPDGRALAVITWPTPELDNSATDTELAIIDLDGGAVRSRRALRSGGHALAWGRDGRTLYFLARATPSGASGAALFAADAAGGEPRVLTADLPACPAGLARAASGDLLVTVATGLDTALDRLDEATGALVRLSEHRGMLTELSASADGRIVAGVRSTADRAPEVWAGPPAGPLACLTDLRPELREVAFGAQERLAWTAPDGLALDGLLILPPGKGRADGPFPTIVVAHGGPYGRFADSFQLNWSPSGQWLATHGYAVFLPNPRGGQGHGVAFAARVAGDVGGADYGDVIAGLDLLIEQGVADPDRLGIGGWSQGGFMTAWAVGQSGRFKAGVMGAGVSDWGMMVAESDMQHFEAALGGSTGWEGPGPHRHDALSPVSFMHRVTTPLLILHGERDERVPVSQGRFFARGLKEYGVPYELVVYPREPHGLQERNHQLDALRRTRAWFDRWLRPAGTA